MGGQRGTLPANPLGPPQAFSHVPLPRVRRGSTLPRKGVPRDKGPCPGLPHTW